MPRLAFVLSVFLALTSCTPAGRPVIGVAETSDWFSLPLDRSLGEGRARPEAISACASEECPQKIAVAVLSVQGSEADRLEKLLHDPSALFEELQRRKAAKASRTKPGSKPVETTMRITPLPSRAGFTLSMAKTDGTRAVDSAIIGWRTDRALWFVIAVGQGPDTVTTIAEKAADRYRNGVN